MNLKNKVLVLLMLFVCNANMAYAVQDFFAEANQRIEQHRKTDITVLVLDSNGQPVPNAQVEVEMQRHAFRWGTAVVADLINSNSSINSIYRQKILENFNAVVFENDLKWPAWEGAWGPYLGWSQAEQALIGATQTTFRPAGITWLGRRSAASTDMVPATRAMIRRKFKVLYWITFKTSWTRSVLGSPSGT